VNNAGIIRRAPALEFSEADWDDVLHINLKTVFFLSQAAAKVMIGQGGGKIINVASMLSFQGGLTRRSHSIGCHPRSDPGRSPGRAERSERHRRISGVVSL
jgi:NAD(P)-dependent dehydrogenase (short-subunit alcohol dehydrogenase family)